jgi:hypothetical protein
VRVFFELEGRHRSLHGFAEGVGALYTAACYAARDLASVERLLTDADESRQALALEREQLMQQLSDASDQLDRICHLGLEERDSAFLETWIDELHRATEAMQTVNRLLAEPGSRRRPSR